MSVEQAREVTSGTKQYVGVFRDADIADVCQKAAVRFRRTAIAASHPCVCQRIFGAEA